MTGVTLVVVVIAGLLALVAAWLLQSALLLVGAKVAGIAGRSFARCLGVTAIALVATVPAALLLSALPVVGGLVGCCAGFLVTAAAGCGLFHTDFGKALFAAVLAWLLALLLAGALVLVLAVPFFLLYARTAAH